MLLETRAQHEPFLGAPRRRSAAPAPRGSPAPPARLILSRGHQQMANWCWGLWARCPRHPEPLGGDFQMMLAPSSQRLWLRARCELLCPGCCSSTGSTSSAGRSWERFGDLQEQCGEPCMCLCPAGLASSGVPQNPLQNTILQDLPCPQPLPQQAGGFGVTPWVVARVPDVGVMPRCGCSPPAAVGCPSVPLPRLWAELLLRPQPAVRAARRAAGWAN